ncbi:zinc ribbon domain-containing protein, partial [Megamonas funiformis]|uniref:zinc ribbon domain-containing protein n=1 Tax=Megamonas funiformis TaxID=437897 RepID=UPI00265D45AD
MKENNDVENSVQEILKEFLAKDINLLSSRDSLYNQLDNKVSGKYRRDLSLIQKALQNNIGELFLKASIEDTDKAKDEAKNKAREILRQNNMQEKPIQKIIDAFIYALEWDKPKEKIEINQKETAKFIENEISQAKIETVETEKKPIEKKEPVAEHIKLNDEKEKISDLNQQEQEKNEVWTCSCGKVNNKNFCSVCGKKRPAKLEKSEKWICPSCGRTNDKNFCFYCGEQRPDDGSQAEPKSYIKNNQVSNEIPNTLSNSENISKIEQINPPLQNQSNNTSTKKFLGSTLSGVILGVIVVAFVLIGFYVIGGDDKSSNNVSSNISNSLTTSKDKKEVPSVDSDLSLGGLELGYSIDQMHEILGKETSIDEKGIYKFYNYSDIQVGIKDGKIDALVSNSSAVATKRGIHQGSSLEDVFNKYGDNYNKMDYDDLVLYEYTFAANNDKNGILRFAISKSNNQVSYISVRIPEEENTDTKSSDTNSNKSSTEKNTNMASANEAVQALNSYYAAITRHDMRAAYNVLSDDMQTHMGSLNDYADG